MMKMERLRACMEMHGYTDVTTYIQSGNVVFTAPKTELKKLDLQLAKLIEQEFDFEVPVQVITADQLQAIAAANPFLQDTNVDLTELHVTFLNATPDAAKIALLEPLQQENNTFRWINKAVYLRCPKGYSNTKLTNAAIESKLKVMATTRNWKTVLQLCAMTEQ